MRDQGYHVTEIEEHIVQLRNDEGGSVFATVIQQGNGRYQIKAWAEAYKGGCKGVEPIIYKDQIYGQVLIRLMHLSKVNLTP